LNARVAAWLGQRFTAATVSLILGIAVSWVAAAGPATAAPAGVRLAGNVHALAQARFDRGPVPPSLAMNELALVLRRDPARASALSAWLTDQQNPQSSHYHQWLTPTEFGARFGADDGELALLTEWLRAQGFSVAAISAGRGELRFRGTAAQAETAFDTPIHFYEVAGAWHFANARAPQVPTAISELIAGIRGLHDFRPHTGIKLQQPRSQDPLWSAGLGQNEVGPSDYATIYNLNTLYQAKVSGTGVTIVIAAQSDVDPAIAQDYWQAFGVYATQRLTTLTVPYGSNPGRTGDANEDEAYLDIEIAGGLAPGANLVLVADADALNAANYAVDQNLGAILNVSFGVCESADGASNAAIAALWQQAVAEGMTVVVAAGDDGDADCDTARRFTPGTAAIAGLAVNALASPATALAVGGTDFDPSKTQSWSESSTPTTLASALGYQPEMVWNDTCTNSLTAAYYGYTDITAFCNAATLPGIGANPFLQIAGASGGLSSCSEQTAAGACAGGYATPAWQTGVVGIGTLATRGLPDVSTLATSWLLCSYESTSTPCAPASGKVMVAGGTSAAAPAVAAILALVDQSKQATGNLDGRQGLITPLLYALAALEYGSVTTPNAAGLAACNAGLGAAIGTNCVFNDITSGTNAMPCDAVNYLGEPPGSAPVGVCVAGTGNRFGIIEQGGAVAYPATPGFDLATGLGSLNAGNLVAALSAPPAPRGLSATVGNPAVTLQWSSDPKATSYNLYAGSSPGREGTTPMQTAVSSTHTSLADLAPGQTYYFTVTAVSAFGISPPSNEASVTTVPAIPTGLHASPSAGSMTVSWNASVGATTYDLALGTKSGAESPAAGTTGLTTTTFSLTGLNPGQTYYFTVAALDAGGASTSSAEVTATVPPNACAGLTASPGNGSITLSWGAAAGATSYEILEGTSPGTETLPVQTGVAGTSATIDGLTNGTNYNFRVVAMNAGGNAPASNEANATPSAPAKGGGAMNWGMLLLLVAAVARRAMTAR